MQSGNVTGYVYSEYITVGNEAQKKAEELVQKKDTENAKEAFTYAESKEEEAARFKKRQNKKPRRRKRRQKKRPNNRKNNRRRRHRPDRLL